MRNIVSWVITGLLVAAAILTCSGAFTLLVGFFMDSDTLMAFGSGTMTVAACVIIADFAILIFASIAAIAGFMK